MHEPRDTMLIPESKWRRIVLFWLPAAAVRFRPESSAGAPADELVHWSHGPRSFYERMRRVERFSDDGTLGRLARVRDPADRVRSRVPRVVVRGSAPRGSTE